MSERKTSTWLKFVQVMLVLLVFAGGLAGGLWLAEKWKPKSRMESTLAVTDFGARGFSKAFAEELADPAFDGVAVSMVVLDEDGEIWFASPMAHTAMCPASALKVLTTGVALAKLGPDFRFETKLASAATSGQTLDGDLVILGGGDPTLSSKTLQAMVDDLVKSGILRIDGRVLADASIFPEHPMSDHWNWGDVGNAYGAGAHGLNVDHNRMVVRFRPAASAGEPAKFLGASAKVSGVEWNNLVVTGPPGSGDGVVVYSEPYGRRVTFRGTVPAGAGEFAVRAAIPNPPEFAVGVVRDALLKKGVEITGRVHPASPADQVMAATKSAPLIDIIRNIHHTSDNVEAQCVLLTLAPHGNPVAVVREHWLGQGVNFFALRMLDGSGLARANMIRAIDLAKVTHTAIAAPHGREFFESLPVYQDGAVRSKPGWMSGVTTSTGTIITADGRRMTYAFMANAAPDAQAVGSLRHRLRTAVVEHAGGEIGRGNR